MFRIVPDLYCCGGDVVKDNGFGCYSPESDPPAGGENFTLNHTVPGEGFLPLVINPPVLPIKSR